MLHPRPRLIASLAFAALVLTACPSYTQMPEGEREATRGALTHRERQLAVSMYAGPFFRDARYRLLAGQRPEDLALVEGLDGQRIDPGAPDAILPAGTPVRIVDVRFPTASEATSRSLLTPRYFTWVMVEVPGHERPHVLVVRDEFDSHEAFLEHLGRWLSPEDVGARVQALPDAVREAVREKRLVRGMSADAARMAWGWPLRASQKFEDGVRIQTWTYEGGDTIALRDDEVVSWSGEQGPPAS